MDNGVSKTMRKHCVILISNCAIRERNSSTIRSIRSSSFSTPCLINNSMTSTQSTGQCLFSNKLFVGISKKCSHFDCLLCSASRAGRRRRWRFWSKTTTTVGTCCCFIFFHADCLHQHAQDGKLKKQPKRKFSFSFWLRCQWRRDKWGNQTADTTTC